MLKVETKVRGDESRGKDIILIKHLLLKPYRGIKERKSQISPVKVRKIEFDA